MNPRYAATKALPQLLRRPLSDALLHRFEIVKMAGDAIAVAGAPNFRLFASARDQNPQDN
jgi:hypothetical protein